MECEKREIGVYRQGRVITDQFYIDDDYNVPDAKSDVKDVILGKGTIDIEDMKAVENYIRVSGKMYFRVLYVAEGSETRLASLEGHFPFEEMIYMEEAQEENLFVKQAEAELTVTMIHSLKLNIKTLAELQICSEGKAGIEITTDMRADFPVYKKHRQENLLKMVLLKKDTYRIKEEITLGGTKESVGTLLWSEAVSRRLDTRLDTDALILQGELLLFCFYESLEGKLDWIEQTIPYEGRMECYGAGEDMYHQIYASLCDVNVDVRMDEDGEMRLLGVEATLEARILVCEEEKLEVLEDIYSLNCRCIPDLKEERAERLLMQNHSKCKVTERLSLPEIKDDILQICHSSARIQVEHTEAQAEGIRIEGVLHIWFLYVKTDDARPFDVWQGMVPFSYLLESNEMAEEMNYDISSAVEQLAVGLMGNDEIEVKAVLAFHTFLRKPVYIHNIESVECEPLDMEEMEKRPGIVGYIVKAGDDLWSLAKNYNTTVEGIMKVNEMETDAVREGDKILIFKENLSIL